MPKTDKRVDVYIAKSADFAQPIMDHLRKLIHTECPDVEETMKWSFPHFDYNGIMCSMAAFKQHCSFTFWKGSLMKDPQKVMENVGETAMGQFGRITELKDLPSDKILLGYIKEAAKLNEDGVKLPAKSKAKKELVIPGYFIDTVKKNKKALETFDSFSYTNKKEYVEWVTEAKTEATREKRLTTTVEWMSEGKIRNWKYVKC
ncbi:MAG: DUF1801 domain-containing protein [Bacteroidia bacterium]|nr:DUF1801 domain-containing protein [Bacteroidia bacterium]